jgi:hypothetical protein
MIPPAHSELFIIVRGSGGVSISREHTPEYTERTAGVKVRGDDQHAFRTCARQAFGRVFRFRLGG